MKKEQAIRLTVTRYYVPGENNTIDYTDLLESVGIEEGMFNVSAKARKWLLENMKAVASYDKHSVDEGVMEVKEFLFEVVGEEPPEYLFEVVEFTTHNDGGVTEEVIHTCKDTVIEDFGPVPEPPITSKLDHFYELHRRSPSTKELFMFQEAEASVALDKGDVGTFSLEEGKPND